MTTASIPDPALRADWESEIFGFQREAMKAMTPSMLVRLDVQDVWSFALHKAAGELRKHGETLNGVPRSCPFAAERFVVVDSLDLAPLLAIMPERAEAENHLD